MTGNARTRVKICGIRDPEHAIVAARAGADAVGLVFYPPSPRHLEARQARAIVETLPPFVAAVGVFVDRPAAEIRAVCDEVGLSVAQIHGKIEPSQVEELQRSSLRVVVGLRLSSAADLAQWHSLGPADAFLFDTHLPGALPGGTGQTFPWQWLTAEDRPEATILAGGLTPENVGKAIRAVRPFAVDVSSGVETSPGKKSAEKIRAFLAAVRAEDAKR